VLGSAAHAPAGATLDAAELLDVDVHELAGARALVAHGLLEAKTAEPAHAHAVQDRRHRRERHLERFRDLGGGEAQASQRDDRLHTREGRAIGDSLGRR
jgi:hypothetical protein